MKILIIEDEAFAADALEKLILDFKPDTRVLDKLESVEESVEWFSSHPHPDLVFCDIHLSDGSSFEIFEKTPINAPVIFTTAYNEYAIEAFKVNSIDYLLKPVKKEELERAIIKYEDLSRSSFGAEMEKIQHLLLQTQSSRNKKSRFLVKSGQTIKSIGSEEVAYFMAEEGVVLLVSFDSKRYVINYTLDQLNDQLDSKVFFRANRQLIVNIHAVKEVHPYFKGRLQLVLEPQLAGDQVISSSKAASFKEWLDL